MGDGGCCTRGDSIPVGGCVAPGTSGGGGGGGEGGAGSGDWRSAGRVEGAEVEVAAADVEADEAVVAGKKGTRATVGEPSHEGAAVAAGGSPTWGAGGEDGGVAEGGHATGTVAAGTATAELGKSELVVVATAGAGGGEGFTGGGGGGSEIGDDGSGGGGGAGLVAWAVPTGARTEAGRAAGEGVSADTATLGGV